MSDRDLGYWLMLNGVSGVGPIRFLRLVERFGSARQVFEAGRSQLLAVKGMILGIADNLLEAMATRTPEGELAASRYMYMPAVGTDMTERLALAASITAIDQVSWTSGSYS